MTDGHTTPAALAAACLELGAGGYNRAEAQRARILDRLRCGPASRLALEVECCASSATKRISELRRMGWRITSDWAEVPGPNGTVGLMTVYTLTEPDSRQADLFESL